MRYFFSRALMTQIQIPGMLLLGAMLLWGSGCAVTDEIEFSDSVNYPPEIVSVSPSNEIVKFANAEDTLAFKVTVWDPNETGNQYAGRVKAVETLSSMATNIVDERVCDVTPPDLVDGGGAQVTVTCRASLIVTNASDVTTVVVSVVISDRAFSASNEVAEGARELKMSWTLEVYPTNEE